jgi:succinate dehydrogenase flavin-adding protein (antitoxin of CptAB toxin-antitoxin module)
MKNTQMTAKQKQTLINLFTEEQWDMIYNFVGNALDDDDFDAEDVYAIRNKIHALFN